VVPLGEEAIQNHEATALLDEPALERYRETGLKGQERRALAGAVCGTGVLKCDIAVAVRRPKVKEVAKSRNAP
jgi:hypothetical protein